MHVWQKYYTITYDLWVFNRGISHEIDSGLTVILAV
jgi:hypothetical protein